MTALRRTGEPERAVAFLADRSAMVRACARYVVRQAGGDPVAWYRERCARAGDPLLPPGAVIGLAECGERADADTLWALLAHPSAAVRARAVAGLRVLDTADVRRLHPLLDDPAPGVVRETVLAVEPSVHLLSDEWLGERLDAGRPRHVRVGALRLAFRRGGSARAGRCGSRGRTPIRWCAPGRRGRRRADGPLLLLGPIGRGSWGGAEAHWLEGRVPESWVVEDAESFSQ